MPSICALFSSCLLSRVKVQVSVVIHQLNSDNVVCLVLTESEDCRVSAEINCWVGFLPHPADVPELLVSVYRRPALLVSRPILSIRGRHPPARSTFLIGSHHIRDIHSV